MNRIRGILTLAFALLIIVASVAVSVPAVTADDSMDSTSVAVPTPLIVTEVCYNPTFMEHNNTDEVSTTADVLEFVEVYNPSAEAVSLKDAVIRYSSEGYEGEFKENALVAVSTSDMTLAPRGVAVICIYGSEAAKMGMTYDTDEGIKGIFEIFGKINVNLAETLPEENFIIAPRNPSGSPDPISENTFRFTNTVEDAVIRVVSGDTLLCETHYNAALWNRNACSVNMMIDPAVDPDHPNATVPFNESYPTPGYLYTNQYPDADLTVDNATERLKVLEYNICASESSQKDAAGLPVTILDRMGKLESMIDQHQPDVICLPEFNNLWLSHVKKYLAREDCVYDAFGCSSEGNDFGKKDTTKKWDLINLIMYNKNKYECLESGYYWCSRAPERRGTKTWEDGTTGDMARCINWVILRDKETGAEFFFAGVHIDAKVPMARTHSTNLIIKKATELSGGRPVVMTGDWNCHESTVAYWNLHKDGYGDARYLTDSVANMSIYATTNKWGENTDGQTRPPIDHCIISLDSISVNSAHRDLGAIEEGVYASDHYATVYDLSYVNVNAKEPETEAPTEVPTETPTEMPTEMPTEAPTVPVTDAPVVGTDAPADETASTNEATEEAHGTPDPKGCTSTVALSVLAAALVAGVVMMKKREE